MLFAIIAGLAALAGLAFAGWVFIAFVEAITKEVIKGLWK